MHTMMRISVVVLAVTMGAGCATAGPGTTSYNRAPQGALVGSLVGAGLGAIVGHQSGHTAEGAAIGAGVGAAGGYMVGNEQDKEAMRAETAQQVQSATAAANMVVINVRNSNGSVTPVTLTRQGNAYIGPKGEHYLQVPTEEQLRPVYGF